MCVSYGSHNPVSIYLLFLLMKTVCILCDEKNLILKKNLD
jgi:hypothetical protein